MATVDVIIPTRNRQRLTVEAAQSVLNQTFDDLHLYIVDDGSSDDTVDVVNAAVGGDPRVTVIRRAQNGGQMWALQEGLASGQSPWVASLDSDDLWLPNKLERQLAMAADPVDVVLCWWRWVRPDGSTRLERHISGEGTVSPLLTNNMDIPLIRRKHLQSMGGFLPADGPFGVTVAHTEFFLRMLTEAHVTVVPQVLVHCRDHAEGRNSDNLGSGGAARQLDEMVAARHALLREWPAEEADLLFSIAARYLSAGDRPTALRLMARSLRRAPMGHRAGLLRRYAPFVVRTWFRHRAVAPGGESVTTT
jgi:glycosyltransferase involved in cell wall biosynthesis